MSYFILNLFLAMAWTLINGQYSSVDFIVGFIVGYFTLSLCQPFGLKTGYFKKFTAFVKLVIYFCYEMIVSVAKVVWDVITPTHLSQPDIVYVPLDAETDLEITLLANMVSLTPGSLSLDVTPDKKYLILHVMFAPDHESVKQDIKQGMEARILEVTRG